MVELRLVGDGGEAPTAGNPQVVEMLETVLEAARRGEVHSVALVACGESSFEMYAHGHDLLLCGGLDALQRQILDYALEAV